VLKESVPKESVDVVYTAPAPFGFYENKENIGGEERLVDYITNLINLCNACKPVLKESGSIFIQIPDVFTPYGDLAGIPSTFEHFIRAGWFLNDRLLWHRKESINVSKYQDRGFLKNYEFIFHLVKDMDLFYINTHSKYIRTSVHSYAIEDSYFSNEFDSGLPEQLTRIIIDTSCPENGTILDPLAGTAKVGVVAKKMNRNFIGIDINKEVVEMCKIRLGIN
jgi:DNA modification methylase